MGFSASVRSMRSPTAPLVFSKDFRRTTTPAPTPLRKAAEGISAGTPWGLRKGTDSSFIGCVIGLGRTNGRSGVRVFAVSQPLESGQDPRELAKAEIQAAANTIDRIVNAVVQEMMISEGVAFVAGEKEGDMTVQVAIENAVEAEADLLNDTFLATLMRYTKAAHDRGQSDMADLLTRVYEATIAHVTSAMPLEMRLLAKLTEEPSGAKREEMLRAAIPSANAAEEGSKEPGSTCDLEALGITCNRMVEDMEAKPEVPDRVLLVKLCLVREEIRKIALELKGMDAPEVVKFSTVIPARVSHFIKELMPVGERGRRMALLEKVFRGDWEGAAPDARLTQKQRINNAKFRTQEDNVPDVVRPGSLLSALLRLQLAMEKDKDKLAINKRKIERVAEIRHEAVHVMKRVAFE